MEEGPYTVEIDYERLAVEIVKQLPPINVTVNIANPLGGEDWDKLLEDKIGPAIKRAKGRGVSLDP
ncbi:MAG: hypothetical protein ACE5DW_06850 [Thermodesulfobacteriota bacterium]